MPLKPVKTVDENGEVKVDIVDAPKPENSLSGYTLDDQIMDRFGAVIKEDAENLKIRDEKYQGLPESLRPRLSTQKGTRKAGARTTGTLLDPFNRTGGRQAAIDKIIKEGGQSLIDSYNPETGKYGELPEWNRTMDGVIDDDITKGLVLRQQQERAKTIEYQNLPDSEKEKIDSLTPTRDILKTKDNIDARTTLRETIKKMEGGVKALDGKGDLPTKDALLLIQEKLKPLQQKAINDQALHDADVADKEQTTASRVQADIIASDQLELNRDIELNRHNIAKRNATTNENTLALAQTKAENELTQQTFENKDKVAYRNYQSQEADKLRAFTATENAAQRSTQMEINLLGREDTREQRAYDRKRDERQDRQMMIMQMMKGLQNFGSAMSF